MNNKNMTLIIAAILVIAATVIGAGVFLYKGSGGSGDYVPHTSLPILGNANEDDRIDQDDIDIINDIIDGKKELSDYEFADANNDGKVTAADRKIVQNIIDGEPTKAFVIDQNESVIEVQYPLKNVVTVNADMLSMFILIGGENSIAGFVASNYAVEQQVVVDAGATKLAGTREINNANYSGLIALDADLHEEGGIGAIFAMTDAAVSDKIDDINAAGIPVLRIKCSAPIDQVNACLTIGVLLGTEVEEQARDYYEKTHALYDMIDNKLKDLSDDEKVKCISLTMWRYITEIDSAYTQVTEAAGGNNLTIFPGDTSSKLETEDAITMFDAAEWMISFRTRDYIVDDVVETWENANNSYLHAGKAYIDGNMVFINASMPVPCRVAYCAEIFYPELFEEGFGDKIFQEYVDAFLGYLEGTGPDGSFDVKLDMTTTITKADYDTAKAS
ncbi:MAG: hypothetical protein ACOX1N_04490 [Candidatus Methanomethylophilaceae archaeon]|jgi:iron complex transport system substrate-binding protein